MKKAKDASRRLFLTFNVKVPIDRSKEVHEAFQDARHYEVHQDPFGHLSKEGLFDDLAKAEADDQHDQGNGYRCPDHNEFGESYLVNHIVLF